MEIRSIARDAAVAGEERRRPARSPIDARKVFGSPVRDLAGASIEDIDYHTRGWPRVRDMLHGEGASSDRELSGRERLVLICGADLLCTARRPPPFEHI